jgi:hypothetical protein
MTNLHVPGAKKFLLSSLLCFLLIFSSLNNVDHHHAVQANPRLGPFFSDLMDVVDAGDSVELI